MRVFLTGASGYVGGEILEKLLAHGHTVTALEHRRPPAPREGVTTMPGDIRDPASLHDAMAGCEAVIHLVGIIVERPLRGITFERIHLQGTVNVLEAARKRGIRRYIHMSALGTRPGAAAVYHQTKWAAEEAVRASGLDWTIFRPSLVAGRKNEVIKMLSGVLRFAPVFPIFGDGRYKFSPIPVGDLAEAFVRSLAMPETVGKIYEAGGREAIPYKEMVRLIAAAAGRRPLLLHVPAGLMRAVVPVAQYLPGFPLTKEQLTMLLEGNDCDGGPFLETFGLHPVTFAEGLREWVRL
jgi:uncharacterized protein YbjT (DUF2867 family)